MWYYSALAAVERGRYGKRQPIVAEEEFNVGDKIRIPEAYFESTDCIKWDVKNIYIYSNAPLGPRHFLIVIKKEVKDRQELFKVLQEENEDGVWWSKVKLIGDEMKNV